MDGMKYSVSVHIQRAISDAINNQVLPQLQNGPDQDMWQKRDGTFLLRDWNIMTKIIAIEKLEPALATTFQN